MRASRIVMVCAAAAVWLSCSREQVKVDLNCVTKAGPLVECEVKQTLGKSEVEVCWDFAVTCNNGTKVTPPRSCTKVKDGGTTQYTITADKLVNADKCDGGPVAKVSNITLNGQASQ